MEYLHRRKESPMQGMSGLWGGVGSNLISGSTYPPAPSGADPVSPSNGYTGDAIPMTGGSNWFSPGYLGYEDENNYQFPNGKTLDQIYYRALQNTAYNWWFLVFEQNDSENYTMRYGARIAVPDGLTEGQQQGPFNLSAANYGTFGTKVIPNDGEAYYLGWHSGVNGDQQVGPPHYVDNTSGGSIGFESMPNTTPTDGQVINFNNNETGEHFHVHVTYDNT